MINVSAICGNSRKFNIRLSRGDIINLQFVKFGQVTLSFVKFHSGKRHQPNIHNVHLR